MSKRLEHVLNMKLKKEYPRYGKKRIQKIKYGVLRKNGWKP